MLPQLDTEYPIDDPMAGFDPGCLLSPYRTLNRLSSSSHGAWVGWLPGNNEMEGGIMITPASVADWVMFGGLLGALCGYAALGYRSILEEARTEKVAEWDGRRTDLRDSA